MTPIVTNPTSNSTTSNPATTNPAPVTAVAPASARSIPSISTTPTTAPIAQGARRDDVGRSGDRTSRRPVRPAEPDRSVFGPRLLGHRRTDLAVGLAAIAALTIA